MAHDKIQGRCPGLVGLGPVGATSRYFGDRLITMNENPMAGSYTFGARENRMNLLLSRIGAALQRTLSRCGLIWSDRSSDNVLTQS